MKTTHTLASAALIACALFSGPSTFAQVSGTVSIGGNSGNATISFGEQERRIIQNYYVQQQPQPVQQAEEPRGGKHKNKGLPPGLQKKMDRDGQLPPGLQKRVNRGEPLPPGLEPQPLPVALERQLPPPPPEYRRALVGVDLVLVNKKTGIVVDLMANIAP